MSGDENSPVPWKEWAEQEARDAAARHREHLRRGIYVEGCWRCQGERAR